MARMQPWSATSRGVEAAFAELYDAIAPRLLGFLRKATRDPFSAEDLMQQTLLHMHRARGSFITGAPVMPWAFANMRARCSFDKHPTGVEWSVACSPTFRRMTIGGT
jgi:RNA polymerase sigma-70 factor (ECF subfamily)